MNCFLYQLRFNTPVHFGGSDSALSLYSSEDHFRADTLFSALCHTALQLGGSDGLERLLALAQSGRLLLSDSMPWAEGRFYLPKPCCTMQSRRELPSDKRKTMKKLSWIPADRFEDFCQAVRSGEFFEGAAVSYGKSAENIKASVPEQGDTLPYPVGLYHFRENCGLYFLMCCEDLADQQWLSALVDALGVTGIGGKISAGYGKFSVKARIDLSRSAEPQAKWLNRALADGSEKSMLLTTSLPRDDELDRVLPEAEYQLIRRAGFVASDTYAQSPRKKLTQYYLGAGAVMSVRFSGDVYEIGTCGSHPVYRYSKPMFLGVKL